MSSPASTSTALDASRGRSLVQEENSQLFPRIVAGSVGSILTSLAVTPLEVVKVRLQASVEASSSTNTSSAAVSTLLPRNVVPCPRGCGTFVLFNGQMECTLPKSAVSYFDTAGKLTQQAKSALCASTGMSNETRSSSGSRNVGTFGMIRRIFVKEGFVGVYAGLKPTLVMAVPNTVLYFSAYDEFAWRLRKSSFAANSYSQSWIPFLAGGSARFVASSFTAPFEYVRTRQALAVGRNETAPGLLEDFRLILRSEGGISTLYRGLRPTLWRDVPFSSVYWLILERLKHQWATSWPFNEREMSALELALSAFVNGAVAGMVAAACTTPFDVVKTRQQALTTTSQQNTVTSASPTGSRACSHNGATVYEIPHHSMGTFESLAHIARQEGVTGLWRGNQARMLKVAPACAIMISSYEYGKRILG